MGSDNYYMSAKLSDAPTPTPPPATGGGGGTNNNNSSKERKKHDRFNGMSEEEVCKRTLPDHLATDLDVVIVSTVDFHHNRARQRRRLLLLAPPSRVPPRPAARLSVESVEFPNPAQHDTKRYHNNNNNIDTGQYTQYHTATRAREGVWQHGHG